MRLWVAVMGRGLVLVGARRILRIFHTITGLVGAVILTRGDGILANGAWVLAARIGRVMIGIDLARLAIRSVSGKLVVLIGDFNLPLAAGIQRDAVESRNSGLHSTLLFESNCPY